MKGTKTLETLGKLASANSTRQIFAKSCSVDQWMYHSNIYLDTFSGFRTVKYIFPNLWVLLPYRRTAKERWRLVLSARLLLSKNDVSAGKKSWNFRSFLCLLAFTHHCTLSSSELRPLDKWKSPGKELFEAQRSNGSFSENASYCIRWNQRQKQAKLIYSVVLVYWEKER